MIAARAALLVLLALAAPGELPAKAPPEPPIDVFLFLADWQAPDGTLVVFEDLVRIPPVLVPPQTPPTPPAPTFDAEPPEDVRELLSTEPERWRRFTPEERTRAITGARLWSTLDERERRAWRGRFTRWYSHDAERRAELRACFSWWNGLSTEERQEVVALAQPRWAARRTRAAYVDPELRDLLRSLPRQERKALERELEAMTPEERRRHVREKLGL